MPKFKKTILFASRVEPITLLWVCLIFVLTSVSSSNGQLARFGASQDQAEIKAQVVSQYDPVGPDQTFLIAVVLDIQPGWHLYPNPLKGYDTGLPTEILPGPAAGLSVLNVYYPPGATYKDHLLENAIYDIYEGRNTFYVEVKTDSTVGSDLNLQLKIKGLVCGEKSGTCLPWQETASIRIKGVSDPGGIQKQQPGLFGDLNLGKYAKVSPDKPETVAIENPKSVQGTTRSPGSSSVVMPDYQAVEFDDGANLAAGDWVRPLLLALVAGVILNLMPCVLPVIPIKVLSLIQQAQTDRGSENRFKAVKLSMVFSLGIVIVFVVLGAVMSGFGLFYGEQFQSLAFKFVMLLIILLLSLSMMGLFEVTLPSRFSNIAVIREGYLGAFGMGLLATLLATPCSAPLLGPVLTWSLSRLPAITLMVFFVIGVGMAAPYVLLTAFPGLMSKIPKAGPWMIRLKEGMGFIMLGVSAYLVFLFPGNWHLPLIVFCLILAFAVWLSWQVVNMSSAPARKVWARGIAIVLVAAGCYGLTLLERGKTTTTDNQLVAQLLPLHEANQTVMVEFTAGWCPNCKYVEKMVLNREAFKQKLLETDTHLIVADWTDNGPVIKELLGKLGTRSIPFTAVFPGNDPLHPIVLRDIYTLDSILKVLDKANQS